MSFSASINFQPSSSTAPGGYLVDSGASYATRSNGATYGWGGSKATMQDRNSSNSPDDRYDTLAHMQYGGTYTWNIAVPNDTYSVHIVAGDPSYTDSVYKINAENVSVVSGTPSSTNRWVEGSALVTVADGKLTISNASGSSNNKICYVDIESATATDVPPPTTPTTTTPAAPSNLTASASTSQV